MSNKLLTYHNKCLHEFDEFDEIQVLRLCDNNFTVFYISQRPIKRGLVCVVLYILIYY